MVYRTRKLLLAEGVACCLHSTNSENCEAKEVIASDELVIFPAMDF